MVLSQLQSHDGISGKNFEQKKLIQSIFELFSFV